MSNAPNYMFMDWISIRGYNAHHPPAAIGMGYMTALLYKALNDIDALRGGRPRYDTIANNIKAAINRLLWDTEKQLYKDGIPFTTKTAPNEWMPADTLMVTHSAHVNTLAVLYNIAPPAAHAAIMHWVSKQQEYELQPYFMSYVLLAAEQAGMTDEGLSLVNRWRGGIDTVTNTLKENWQEKTDFGYGGDYSHAWGGAPLRFLSATILGVQPGVNSYDTICIRPYIGHVITHASGKVPVGNGKIVKVQWHKSAHTYTLAYSIPLASKALFYYPDGRVRWLQPGKTTLRLTL